MDLATRKWEPLEVPAEANIKGIDGLYVHRHSLVGVQNGLRNGPERVLQAFLDPAGGRVTCVATLDRSHPLYDIPTTGSWSATTCITSPPASSRASTATAGRCRRAGSRTT